MKTLRNPYYIRNYVFLASLILLFLNDHFLKQMFSNGFTGKLSDVVGLVVLPLLLSFLFPKISKYSIAISVVFFIFWKSPYSDSFINFYNQFALIKISRIVDYTDLLAFFVLPIPYFIIKNVDQLQYMKIQKINTLFILIPSIFALMATQKVPTKEKATGMVDSTKIVANQEVSEELLKKIDGEWSVIDNWNSDTLNFKNKKAKDFKQEIFPGFCTIVFNKTTKKTDVAHYGEYGCGTGATQSLKMNTDWSAEGENIRLKGTYSDYSGENIIDALFSVTRNGEQLILKKL